MKENQIKEILFDLYMVDEELKKYETELKDIILEVCYSRPDTEFDDTFKQHLKEEINLKIKSLKRDNLNKKINLSTDLPKESNLLLFMKKFNYILGGASVSTLVILVGTYFMIRSGQITIGNNKTLQQNNISNFSLSNKDDNNTARNNQITENASIKSLASNAFGKISISSAENTKQSGPEGYTLGSDAASSKMASSPMLGSSDENMMISYIPEYYTYTYTDSKEKLNYNTEGLEVLKKIYSGSANFDYKNVSISNLNLSQFNNLKLNNLSLDEDKENGYSIYFNFNDGSLSINKNWQKWPSANYDKNLKITDVPSDESIIKIANEFLSKYNIDIKNYGSPEVISDWKQYYEQSTDKENYYIPTSIGVMYPLIINGKQVYESYGEKIGMTVNVDIVSNKVDGLYGIQTQNYESSKYDLETDSNKLLDVIKIGGNMFSPRYASNTNVKEISSNVKNPSIAYMRTYKYDNNTSYELYVPAMILDVENTTNNYRKNIVIPLTKDSIEEILKNNKEQPVINELPQPIPDIMPLKK